MYETHFQEFLFCYRQLLVLSVSFILLNTALVKPPSHKGGGLYAMALFFCLRMLIMLIVLLTRLFVCRQRVLIG